jgi:hypothetical protein
LLPWTESAGTILFVIAIVSLLAVPIFYYVYFVGKSGQTWA